MSEPVFCQNCGRICKTVHLGDNRMPYCSRDCEIRGWVIDKYEGAIFLEILMLFLAMTLTADYMEVKYSTHKEGTELKTQQELNLEITQKI